MIKRLPVGAVKLDRAFVTGLGIDSSDEALVRALVHSLTSSSTAFICWRNGFSLSSGKAQGPSHLA